MVPETGSQPTAPNPQMVAHAFVQQYYHILHQSPELVYRFYQDSSVLSRPDSNGEMTSVTTKNLINEKILSLNFADLKAEIKTADAQISYEEGVVVMVTGCLTDKANVTRSFAQSFFLAPQSNGYYVLNDVFRYIDDREPSEPRPVIEDIYEAADPVTPEPEPYHASESSALDAANSPVNEGQIVEKDLIVAYEGQIAVENAYEPSNHHERQVPNENEENVPIVQFYGNDDAQATELDPSAPENASKKSYASIVKVQKDSPGSAKIYVPKKTVSQPIESVESAAVPEADPDSVGNAESGDNLEQGEVYSIYVRNLPFSVTDTQLAEEFKKFGPIKPGGVQIRINKQQGYCFGFIDFLSPSSMNSAIQASPINFAGRQAVVEMKKGGSRGGSIMGRARIPPRRGGFRTDIYRGRGGSYGGGGGGGGQGFGRNDHGIRGEFPGRGRGPGGYHGEGYYQQGRGSGRGGRPSAPKPYVVITI